MKKIMIISMALCVATGLAFTGGCKKSKLNDLQYGEYSDNQGWYIEANVVKKSDKSAVMRFRISDEKGNNNTIETYTRATDKIDTYPATINPDSVYLMVNGRYVVSISVEESAKNYQGAEMMKSLAKEFDLSGLSKITADKTDLAALKRCLPKIQ